LRPPRSRHNLQRLIERRGHEVHGVGSAEEARRALELQKFPFLILDWMLREKAASNCVANCGLSRRAMKCLFF
jgi:DNA-binding response OmpR family regulator